MEKTQPQNLWCELIKKSHKNRAFHINFIKPQKAFLSESTQHFSFDRKYWSRASFEVWEGGRELWKAPPNNKIGAVVLASHRATAVSASTPNIRRTTKHQATNSPNIFLFNFFQFRNSSKNFCPWGFCFSTKTYGKSLTLSCEALLLLPWKVSPSPSKPEVWRGRTGQAALLPSFSPIPPLTPHGYTSPSWNHMPADSTFWKKAALSRKARKRTMY